jgi:hypothetical protein
MMRSIFRLARIAWYLSLKPSHWRFVLLAERQKTTENEAAHFRWFLEFPLARTRRAELAPTHFALLA